MKYKPHPGYELLWDLHLDIGSSAEGGETDFSVKIRKLNNCKIPKGMEIYDSSVPGLNGAPDVPIRVYKQSGAKNAPLLIDIHGGGFVSGGLDNSTTRASRFCEHVPCTVISVGYRLAPDSIFPAALEDCYAVLLHAYEHAEEFGIDQNRIAVFGTSAGGALAASLCLYVRDKGDPKISMQILNFPMLDYIYNTASSRQFYEGSPIIEGKDLPNAWRFYLGNLNGTQPSYYAVPALADDLSGLPPACIITCEYDPLRDEGIDYARRLMQFAVPTELYSLPRVPHAFDMIPAPLTEWVREGMYNALRREFGIMDIE